MTEKVMAVQDKEIVKLLLNRPDFFNAFDLETIERLAKLLIGIAVDTSIRGVVISGQGKAFCAGGDLKWMIDSPLGPSAALHGLAANFHQAIVEIRRMRKPVIAAINGMAAGGGFSLALACDFRIMSRSAILRQAYTSNGLCIDGGGTFTLPRIVGLARAMEIIAFDAPIPSEKALNWGLATEVVEDGHALDRAVEMAHELSGHSLNSFGWSKQLLNDSFDNAFESQLENERSGICSCADHLDGKEGLKAFAEKRKPAFKHE